MTLIKTLIAAGQYSNVLERPNTTLSASQTPSSLYPLSRLKDGRPSQMFILPAIAADDYLNADLNQVLGGDAETWDTGVPVGPDQVIETGSGAVTEETTGSKVVGGSGSGFDLANGASGNAQIIWDVLALADEPWMVDLYGLVDNADSPLTAELQNLQTGAYLTAAGGWSATQQNFLAATETSLTQHTLSFAVQSFAACRRHDVRLRLRLHMDSASASRTHNYDDVLMYPGINLASIHGHNLDPILVAELRKSTDAFSASDDLEATFSVDVPTFYASLSSIVYRRYWRIPALTGTNSTLSGSVAIGLPALTYAKQILKSPRQSGLEFASFLPQEQAETRLSREQWRVRRGKWRQRIVQMSFRHTAAQQQQFLDELLVRTNDGVDPIIIVVRDDRTSSCVHARKPVGQTSFTMQAYNSETTDITLVESAFGVDLE